MPCSVSASSRIDDHVFDDPDHGVPHVWAWSAGKLNRRELLAEGVAAREQQVGRGDAEDRGQRELLLLYAVEEAAAQKLDAHRLEVGPADACDGDARCLPTERLDGRRGEVRCVARACAFV